MPNTLLAACANDLVEQMDHSYVDVGQFSGILVKGNPVRRFLFVQNDGNKDVYIMFNRPAAIHQGICLKANGANAMFTHCNASLCALDLFAITNSATPVRVLITEGY